VTGALVRLCRPYYSVPMALAYALTLYYARGGQMVGAWAGFGYSTAALALVIAAAYVLNDVLDLAIDRVNAAGRPIPCGRISRRAAAVWSGVLLAGGLALSAGARPAFAAALALVAAALLVYDLASKRLGVGKQLLVAALMTSMYPLALAQAGGAAGSRVPSLAVFAAWMFLTAFGYEVLKDLRDIRGDRAAAARTFDVHRRPAVWRRAADACLLAAALGLVLPLGLGCRWVYMAVAAVAMAAAVASVFVPVRRAIHLVYAECFLVGVAAAADAVIFGF